MRFLTPQRPREAVTDISLNDATDIAIDGTNELSLWKEDKPRGDFSREVAERLDQAVCEALEAEGYTLTQSV